MERALWSSLSDAATGRFSLINLAELVRGDKMIVSRNETQTFEIKTGQNLSKEVNFGRL